MTHVPGCARSPGRSAGCGGGANILICPSGGADRKDVEVLEEERGFHFCWAL